MRVKKSKNRDIIGTCLEIIKTFNPVTHSIDTHCTEILGDVSQPVSFIDIKIGVKYHS